MTSPPRPPWDGRGLPAAAADRIARSRGSGLSASLLSISGSTGIESVGFSPVGEVMGGSVVHIGYSGLGGCGYGYAAATRDSYSFSTARTLTSRTTSYGGYGPYVRAVESGYQTALGRMLEEARGIGAHGVVGVKLTVDRRDTGAREFIALGTAVRGQVGRHAPTPERPFTTQLSGTDVTRALRGGWVPVSIVVAISLGVRHDDAYTRSQAMSWANNEMDGYTELVSTVRHEAREVFAERIRASGATRAYVTSMSLDMWAIEPTTGHHDHAAESAVIGGGLVSFRRSHPSAAPSNTVTVMPLRDRKSRS